MAELQSLWSTEAGGLHVLDRARWDGVFVECFACSEAGVPPCSTAAHIAGPHRAMTFLKHTAGELVLLLATPSGGLFSGGLFSGRLLGTRCVAEHLKHTWEVLDICSPELLACLW